MSTCLSKEDID